MHVCFDDPFEAQFIVANVLNDFVGTHQRQAARGIVDFHYRVHDRAGVAAGVFHHIGKGVGGFVEEGDNFGFVVEIDGDIVEHDAILLLLSRAVSVPDAYSDNAASVMRNWNNYIPYDCSNRIRAKTR